LEEKIDPSIFLNFCFFIQNIFGILERKTTIVFYKNKEFNKENKESIFLRETGILVGFQQ